MHAGSASALLGGQSIHSSACTSTDSRACQRMAHGVLGRYSGYSQVLQGAPGCFQGTLRAQSQGRGEAHVPLLHLVRPRKHMVWSIRVLGDTQWTRWPPGYSGGTHRAPSRLLARDFAEPALVRTRRPTLPPSAVPSSAPTSAAPTQPCAAPKLSCTASLRPDGMAVAC